jgi:hypothetical protein
MRRLQSTESKGQIRWHGAQIGPIIASDAARHIDCDREAGAWLEPRKCLDDRRFQPARQARSKKGIDKNRRRFGIHQFFDIASPCSAG